MIDKIKQHKTMIVTSWAYNHKLLILLITAIVVILVQNFGHYMPAVSITSEVYAQNTATYTPIEQQCDYKCLTTQWVEMRTDEIMIENVNKYRTESRYQALIEANEMITSI